MTSSQTGLYPQTYIEQERAPDTPRRFETQTFSAVQKVLIGAIVLEIFLLAFFLWSYLTWLNS